MLKVSPCLPKRVLGPRPLIMQSRFVLQEPRSLHGVMKGSQVDCRCVDRRALHKEAVAAGRAWVAFMRAPMQECKSSLAEAAAEAHQIELKMAITIGMKGGAHCTGGKQPRGNRAV